MNKKVVGLLFLAIMLLLTNCNPASVLPANPSPSPAVQTTEALSATPLPVAPANPGLTPVGKATESLNISPTPTTASVALTPLPQRNTILSSANAKNIVDITRWGVGSGQVCRGAVP